MWKLIENRILRVHIYSKFKHTDDKYNDLFSLGNTYEFVDLERPSDNKSNITG